MYLIYVKISEILTKINEIFKNCSKGMLRIMVKHKFYRFSKYWGQIFENQLSLMSN
jgi:hypothetical protein